MKVLFKHLIAGYTGKMDDAVIYYNKYLNKVIIRKNPKVKIGEHHNKFKRISQNIYRCSRRARTSTFYKVWRPQVFINGWMFALRYKGMLALRYKRMHRFKK